MSPISSRTELNCSYFVVAHSRCSDPTIYGTRCNMIEWAILDTKAILIK